MNQGSSSRRPHILLAEDDPTNQYVFRALLEGAGYEVVVCENGLLALEQARRDPPDLVLLDMMMPVMDGYEVAGRFLDDPAFDGIPVLALTAKAMKGDLERTIDAGCDGYMSKPVSRKDLIDTVRNWLDRPEAEWMPQRRAKRERNRRSA